MADKGTAAPPEIEDPTTEYAEKVLAGEIVAGRLVRLACKRHLQDLEDGRARGIEFDRRSALRAIAFFPLVLRHYKGEWGRAEKGRGQRFVLGLWQKFIVGSLFGWKWIATGLRRFQTAYIEIARKNGKSALCAGIALLLFVFDNEPGAEVYCLATKRDQAKIVFDDAVAFVTKSRELSRRIDIYKTSMVAPGATAVLKPLAADDKFLDGLNPHGAIIDELHKHPNRAIVDVIETGLGAREQPLQVEITTAGKELESVCFDHHDYSQKVLEGIFDDDTWFGYVANLDDDDDWRDEAAWIKANPNLGVSKRVDYLRGQVRRAINQPAAASECKRLHFDIWTEDAGGWLNMDRWNECATPIDLELLKGRECFGGLDLSSKLDITAYVEIYPPDDAGGLWQIVPFLFVPEVKVEEARIDETRDRVRYDLFADQGLIIPTPGEVVDYEKVKEKIVERSEQVQLAEIGYDPWNASQMANDLDDLGFTMVEVRQGFKTLSLPMKEFEALVISRRLAHGGHRVLRWMASNMAVTTDDADNVKPSKKKSRQRIDGIVAGIIGLSRALDRPEHKAKSVYEGRGALEF